MLWGGKGGVWVSWKGEMTVMKEHKTPLRGIQIYRGWLSRHLASNCNTSL